jgi:Mrp family chromosome partitioning ATPase
VSKYFEVLKRLERHPGDAAGRIAAAEPAPAPREEALPLPAAVTPPVPAAVQNGTPAAGAVPKPAPVAEVAAPAARPAPEVTVETVRPSEGTPRLIQALRGQVADRMVAWRARRAVPLRGIDTLFNNLEALTLGRRPLTLVLAGASGSDSVTSLAVGLAQYAEERGQRALVAELRETADGPVVVEHRVKPAAVASSDERLPVDLHGGTSRDVLGRWRERTSPGADIMFVVGPPLVESVDSALLASHCDGLVLVAVNEETSRAALTAAAERARLTSTPTLGVVVDRGRNRTPPWLGRLIGH